MSDEKKLLNGTETAEEAAADEKTLMDDKDLTQVSGGVYTDTYYLARAQCSLVCSMATAALYAFFELIKPSYHYSDVNANFMSLIYEYAEYHFHVDGKSVTEPKCQAIITVLNMNGYDIEKITEILDTEAAKVA